MSRIYSVSATATITAANTDVDLLEVLPADDKPVRLVGYVIGQTSEVAEAQEEGIRIDVLRLDATVTGSNGTAGVEEPLNASDAAAGFTSETFGTTVATTSGTAHTLDMCAWNVRGSPLERWWPDPDMRPTAKEGQGLFVRWQTTVADDVVVAATFYIEEI
jgi:hypothetical protein